MSDNIDKILNGFANKSLSYKDYLILAGINQGNLGTFTAYSKFAEMSNLTATDIIKYQDELKNPRKLLSQSSTPKLMSSQSNTSNSTELYNCLNTPTTTLLEEEADKVKNYCSDNPSDTACICINDTLIRINQEQIEDEADRMRYCNWKVLEQKYEREYQDRINDYIKRYKEEQKKLKEWRQPVKRGQWMHGRPHGYGGKYELEMVDHHGTAWHATSDWDAIYSSTYILEELKRFYNANHPDIVSERVRSQQPISSKRKSVIQCCTNSIIAKSATVENVLQSCSQTVILNAEQQKNAKKKAEEEAKLLAQKKAEEEERKKEEEERKKEEDAIVAAEIASAKKKKIFGIVIILIIVIGVSAFIYFKLSKQPIILTSVPSTPSLNINK